MSIALYHFHVTQIKRSAGQSAIASAAYRSGEKLHSEYYGEDSDYTKKGGVICSEILLPPYAPPSFSDRETLWNEVEKAERGKKAQLAYSFDIALQNEFSMQENIELARQFLLEQFVSRGMVVDFAVHSPDKDDGGIFNPHFHVMCPIRPLDEHGRWGNKQRREYLLDEHGERIRDEAGNYVFNAVPTTDWGSPDTLEHWRQAWAELCNQKFAEKELDCRIDHRSYERQGIDQLPTVHEGVTVRAMEAKGIRTNKGDLNRWIKATNDLIRNLKKKISALLDWLKEAHEEWVNDQMCHSCTNYECYKGLYSSLNDLNLFEIAYSLKRQFGSEPWCLYQGKHLLSFVDNHDVTRAASILLDRNHLPLLYGLLFGMPGIPCIYYGSEWGAEGRKAPGSDANLRPCFPQPEWNRLTGQIAAMAKARRKSQALCQGDYREVLLTNRQYIFQRQVEGERVLVVVNADSQPYTAHFDAGYGRAVDLLTGKNHDFGGGSELPPYSVAFWRCER